VLEFYLTLEHLLTAIESDGDRNVKMSDWRVGFAGGGIYDMSRKSNRGLLMQTEPFLVDRNGSEVFVLEFHGVFVFKLGDLRRGCALLGDLVQFVTRLRSVHSLIGSHKQLI